jgi:hypothetical protein
MKASIVFATGLILAAGAVAGFSNAAHAGAAGSAGSISAQFSVTGNSLTATAGAVATGKTGAFTTATGSAPAGGTADITAVATGYAGTLTITQLNTTGVDYEIGLETLGAQGAAQGNNFNGTAKTSVNLVPGPTTGVALN